MAGSVATFEPDGRVLEEYMLSRARVRLIQGPRGSGKSSASCAALMMAAQMQAPATDGVRHSRWYVVRNTYDELTRTTLNTWRGLFPEALFGPVKGTRPMVHHVRRNGIDMEVTFLALDAVEDVKKLLSTDISGVYFNEFREIDRRIIDEADAIIGRYPNKKMVPGVGCSRPMIIADTNPPNETHWFAYMSGQVPRPPSMGAEELARTERPDTWEIFLQPPGLLEVRDDRGEVAGYRANPAAENLRWLPDGYYSQMVKGKARTWIQVNVLNRPGADQVGRPVYPTFRRETHVATRQLDAMAGHPLLIGLDFGRTPAAVIGQRVFDRWMILRELCAQQMGAREFARVLKRQLAQWFPGFKFAMWGDPTGERLAEADDISPMLMFRAEGLHVLPAPTNDPVVRLNAVREVLGQMIDGQPRLRVSPDCSMVITGFEGGYSYRKLGLSGGEERWSEEPSKNQYSHPHDALQYLLVGAGEGRALFQSSGAPAAGASMVARPRAHVMARAPGILARRFGRR